MASSGSFERHRLRSLRRRAASAANTLRSAEAARCWIRLGAALLALAYLWGYIRDCGGIRRNILQFRAIPDSGGVRLIALQDPFAGPVAFVADDPRGTGGSGTPARWGASVGLGWPCWLPPYRCDRYPPGR